MGVSDLSGYISGLSGTVDSLLSQITQLQQQLLSKVGLRTISDYQAIVGQQLDDVASDVSTHEVRIDTLEGLYSNLAYNHNSLEVSFTGHTGQLTGNGAHGAL